MRPPVFIEEVHFMKNLSIFMGGLFTLTLLMGMSGISLAQASTTVRYDLEWSCRTAPNQVEAEPVRSFYFVIREVQSGWKMVENYLLVSSQGKGDPGVSILAIHPRIKYSNDFQKTRLDIVSGNSRVAADLNLKLDRSKSFYFGSLVVWDQKKKQIIYIANPVMCLASLINTLGGSLYFLYFIK